ELLDRQPDTAFLRLDREDLGANLIAHLQHVRRLLDAVISDFADVDQAFDAFFKLNKRAEVGQLGHAAVHGLALAVTRLDRIPRIAFELFDAQGELLLSLVDAEHDRFDLVALLELLGRVSKLLGPRDIADVDQAVDAHADVDEDAEVS